MRHLLWERFWTTLARGNYSFWIPWWNEIFQKVPLMLNQFMKNIRVLSNKASLEWTTFLLKGSWGTPLKASPSIAWMYMWLFVCLCGYVLSNMFFLWINMLLCRCAYEASFILCGVPRSRIPQDWVPREHPSQLYELVKLFHHVGSIHCWFVAIWYTSFNTPQDQVHVDSFVCPTLLTLLDCGLLPWQLSILLLNLST